MTTMSDSQIASQRFAGRTVIVTGAAQGMGEAIARRLSAEGASLVLVDLLDHVHGVARDCGEHAVGVVGDVASADTVRTAVELARARGGRVWGLANVAGIHHLGDALETEEADWAQVLSINLTAPWLWSRAILPELVAGGGGSIVIITSINGSFARPRSLAYNSSKSGALGLVRSLAIDYGRQGVRTNSLSPGSVPGRPPRSPRQDLRAPTGDPGGHRRRLCVPAV
jgi:NAD(P)-dependent dehydrogenase (short-subunit alcohol dehydrogenase family)